MSSLSLRPAPVACAIATVFSIAGFCAGRWSGPAAAAPPLRDAPAAAAVNVPRISTARHVAADSPAAGPAAPEISHAWEAYLSSPPTPSSEDAATASIRALAATDPVHALQLARSAATPRERDLFTRAALHGWGSVDPLSAGKWAIENVRTGERRLAVEAIITGSMTHPEDAIHAVTYLCASDPGLASDHGNTLVNELAKSGHFDLAGQFAATGPANYRAAWLATVFFKWGEYQPGAAVDAANAYPDPVVREEALQGVISGWVMSDPVAVVAYAETMSASPVRANAFRDGLQQWASLDAVAATDWMNNRTPSTDLDAGAAAIATSPELVAMKPDIATTWAESIVDPALRSETILDLIRLWGVVDLPNARAYVASSPALSPDTRQLALAALEPSP